MNLLNILEEQNKQIPLAELLRPASLSDFLDENGIISENSPFRNLLDSKRLFSFIMWGPSGCGKTTLARLIARETESRFAELSAVSSGIKDIREIVESSKNELRTSGQKTIVFIDEIHRYNKTQQDALLPYLENGTIFLIGATTENPSFQVIPALLSRVQTVILKPISKENLLKIIRKGYKYLIEKYGKINMDSQTGEFIVNYSDGDARIALNLVENSYFASNFDGTSRTLTMEILENLIQKKAVKYGIDDHYDLASAFQKSLRGSDANAAIYWLAKMLAGGEDPRFISRRLIVTAAEDVGNADPQALTVAINAHKACEILGMPECRIPLSQAVIYIAKAPKSNETVVAIDKALRDIEVNGENYPPPMHLRDAHYKDAAKYGFGKDYLYSHSHPDVKQNFLPDELLGKKYVLDD